MTETVRWSWRSRAAAAFVLAYVAVQVALPAALLLRPRTQRFGWQMYSVTTRSPVIVALRPGHQRDTLDLDTFFARRRAEMDPGYALQLPSLVCRVSPDVAAVEVLQMPDSVLTVHPCR